MPVSPAAKQAFEEKRSWGDPPQAPRQGLRPLQPRLRSGSTNLPVRTIQATGKDTALATLILRRPKKPLPVRHLQPPADTAHATLLLHWLLHACMKSRSVYVAEVLVLSMLNVWYMSS